MVGTIRGSEMKPISDNKVEFLYLIQIELKSTDYRFEERPSKLQSRRQ